MRGKLKVKGNMALASKANLTICGYYDATAWYTHTTVPSACVAVRIAVKLGTVIKAATAGQSKL